MTPQQRAQWNDYGCASRCLLMASQHFQNPPITEGEFCQKYEPFFIPGFYGNIYFSTFLDIGRDMGMFQHLSLCDEYGCVMEERNNQNRIVFVFTGVNLVPKKRNDINHYSVLNAIEAQRFSLFTPSQDGAFYQMDFGKRDWRGNQTTAIITY